MGFLTKMARGLEQSLYNQVEKNVSNTTGVNVRAEVREYSRVIERLEKKLEKLEEEKDVLIIQKGEKEYFFIVRSLKSELDLYKRIRIDIVKGIYEQNREECKERYREKTRTMSEEQLRKIRDDECTPKILKEVVIEELENR